MRLFKIRGNKNTKVSSIIKDDGEEVIISAISSKLAYIYSPRKPIRAVFAALVSVDYRYAEIRIFEDWLSFNKLNDYICSKCFFWERAAYFLGFDKEKEKVFLGFFEIGGGCVSFNELNDYIFSKCFLFFGKYWFVFYRGGFFWSWVFFVFVFVLFFGNIL